MISVYVPTDEEADRLLANVEKWVSALKKLNVASDIAAYIARDFLSPMRVRDLEGEPSQGHDRSLPIEQTNAVGSGIIEVENF